MKKISLVVVLAGLLQYSFSQNVLWEIFQGLSSYTAVSTTKNTPTKVYTITSLASPTNSGLDNYYSRMKGFIKVPAEGDYTFYIASDDGSELWLSTDADSTHKVKICYANGYQGSYTSSAAQKSAPIHLLANNFYYFEALHQEGGGGDWVKVGWTKPGEAPTTINDIPGANITRFAVPDVRIRAVTVDAGRIPLSSKNVILYKANITTRKASTTLKGITLMTGGAYAASDIINFKLWYNKYAANLDSAKLIGKAVVSSSAGIDMIFDSLYLPISVQDSMFLLLTADVPQTASLGATINITEASYSSFHFSRTINGIGAPDTILVASGVKWIEKIDVESVKISQDTLTLIAGATKILTAKVFPDSASFKDVEWLSDNTSIATVSVTGKITTLIDGTVNIIVITKDQGKRDTCALTIKGNNATLKSFYLTPSILTIDSGGVIKFDVVTDPIYISRSTLKWKSYNEDIATIDTSGTLTAKNPGKTIIVATLQGNKEAMCAVTVSFPLGQKDNESEVSLYPVPAHDLLTIKLDKPVLSEVKIYNAHGVAVQSLNMTQDIQTIDVSTLAKGMYIIRITSGNKIVERILTIE